MIGKLLRQFSIDTGIGQKEVAQQLNFSPQRVNNYYRDMAHPPPEFFEMFKRVYKIDLKALIEKEKKEGSIKISHMKPLPVFDFDFMPTSDPNFMDKPDAIKYYMDAPMFADCDAVIKVAGDAMLPEFGPADLIVIKKLADTSVIAFGSPFLIVTKDQRLIRIVRPGADKTRLKLEALNENFDEIDIAKKDIIHIFQVMSKITRIA